MTSLSIITPTYESSDFLMKTLASCVSDKATSITNIICDKLSSDGLGHMLFSQQLPNPIVFSSELDSGPAQAINRGFRLAEGSIIGWINSDDLYASGAIDRALELFERNPNLMMVYGQAEHIDLFGQSMNPYPSLPPTVDLEEFKNGCFICQPTIFFRRELLDEVGFLDETLKTAFDFDWVIRIFKRYSPTRIGYIEQTQAYSRLHSQCLTRKYRKRVLGESINVIASHFYFAPAHWLQTYYEELYKKLPFESQGEPSKKGILDFFADHQKQIDPVHYEQLLSNFSDDIRSQWLDGPIFINTQPDGWVKDEALLLVRYLPSGPVKFSILCNGEWPIDAALNLQITSWDGAQDTITVSSQEDFLLEFEVPKLDVQAHFSWTIRCDQSFIPAVQSRQSGDRRELSFKVLDLRHSLG